jgi:hypothetical protein
VGPPERVPDDRRRAHARAGGPDPEDRQAGRQQGEGQVRQVREPAPEDPARLQPVATRGGRTGLGRPHRRPFSSLLGTSERLIERA